MRKPKPSDKVIYPKFPKWGEFKYFTDEKMLEVRELYPFKDFAEKMELICDMWEKLPEEEKAEYKEMCRSEVERYR